MVSFSLLQQRSSKAKFLDCSTTMDIVAVMTFDGNLTLYRTWAWEKVLSKTVSDFGGQPTSLSFSYNGKVLAVAGEKGMLCVLNIESGVISHAIITTCMTDAIGDILSISWNIASVKRKAELDDLLLKSGGANLALNAGVPELFEPGKDDNKENDNVFTVPSIGYEHWRLFQPIPVPCTDNEQALCAPSSMHYSLLLSLSANLILRAHIFGMFPLFSIKIWTALDRDIEMDRKWIISNGLQSSRISLYSTCKEENQHELILCSFPMQTITSTLDWRSRSAAIFISLIEDTVKLSDIALALGKKWKESTRVIIPKLGLMQTVLDGYELQYTPVEFMYSIVMCGQWHPAAVSTFPQHWDEERLSKLRSDVDSTSKAIIFSIVGKMIPMAQNISLMTRELLSMQRATDDINGASSTDIYHSTFALVRSAEQLLFKIDETLSEARAGRESMLLYLQFIRECASVSDGPTSLATAFKLEISQRPKLMRMFDPRCPRADQSGRNSQAEAVTGTHLYSYLQDQKLPDAVVAARESTNGFIDQTVNLIEKFARKKKENHPVEIECSVGDDVEPKIMDLLIVVDEPSQPFNSKVGPHTEITYIHRSLVSQIKYTKDAVELLYAMQHASTSSSLQATFELSKNYSDDFMTNKASSVKLERTDSREEIRLCCCDNYFVAEVIIPLERNVTVKAKETQLSAFAYVDSENAFHVSVLCQVNHDISMQYYFADTILDGLFGDAHKITSGLIGFYDVVKTNSIYIVGVATAGLDETSMSSSNQTQLYKFDISDMIFIQTSSNSVCKSDRVFAIPQELGPFVEFKKRPIVTSFAIHSLTACGARGILSLLDESGKVLIFDLEEDEDKEDSEPE